MISEKYADLLEEQLDGLCHQANCFHTMGAGIAAKIRRKYPEAYQADINHGKAGDRERLGTYSTAKCWDDVQVFNIYGQYDFGRDRRYTNYEAVYTGLEGVKKYCIENNIKRLGIPRNMGCRLAGGSWNVVFAIIKDIFEDCPEIDVIICEYD